MLVLLLVASLSSQALRGAEGASLWGERALWSRPSLLFLAPRRGEAAGLMN